MSELKIDHSMITNAINTGDADLVKKMWKLHKIDINEECVYDAFKIHKVELIKWLFEINPNIKFTKCILCELAKSYNMSNREFTISVLELLAKHKLIETPVKHECVFFKKVFEFDEPKYISILLENNVDFNSIIIYYVDFGDKYTSIFNYALILKAKKCANLILDHYMPQTQGETSQS